MTGVDAGYSAGTKKVASASAMVAPPAVSRTSVVTRAARSQRMRPQASTAVSGTRCRKRTEISPVKPVLRSR